MTMIITLMYRKKT